MTTLAPLGPLLAYWYRIHPDGGICPGLESRALGLDDKPGKTVIADSRTDTACHCGIDGGLWLVCDADPRERWAVEPFVVNPPTRRPRRA